MVGFRGQGQVLEKDSRSRHLEAGSSSPRLPASLHSKVNDVNAFLLIIPMNSFEDVLAWTDMLLHWLHGAHGF